MKDSNIAEKHDNNAILDAKSVDTVKNDNSTDTFSNTVKSDEIKGWTPKKRNKKYKPPIDKRSFLSLLIGSFVSFSFIIIIGVSLIFVISYIAVGTAHNAIRSANINNYLDALKDGKYGSIPVDKVLGDNGWLEIVDTDANVIYSTRLKQNEYTLGELDNIQRYDIAETVTVSTFKSGTNQDNYLVTKSIMDENGVRQERYLLLDEDYKIIAGSIPTTKTQFTQKEFEYLTYNAYDNGKLNKIIFEDKEGNDYYAIFLDVRRDTNAPAYVLIAILIACIVLLFAIMVFFYVRYINKHVQKPLVALNKAMNDFATDDFREKIDYHGTKEFEQLCDSFNEMAELLNASEEQKSALEQDKNRMLASLSHDLKTPITVIQGFSKAIRDGIVTDADKQKYLELIISKADLMGDLVNEFYEYTKLEHPDFKIEPQKTDIAEFVRLFLADKYNEFDLRGYNLETDIPEEQIFCDVDARQFTHVLVNLTGNFFKYTPKGSTLYFAVEKSENNVVMRIADNGGGISPEARDDIFKPFVVGEKSRNKQGSGLGLAVCQRIVLAHGGTIELSKEPIDGYSTQFDIMLPILK